MPPVDSIFFWLLSAEGSKLIFTGSNQESIRPLANSAPDLIRIWLRETASNNNNNNNTYIAPISILLFSSLKMIKFWRECLLSHEIIETAGHTLEYNPYFGVG